MATEKDIEAVIGLSLKEPAKAIEQFKQLVQQFNGIS
jgi:hypothetical protein